MIFIILSLLLAGVFFFGLGFVFGVAMAEGQFRR